MQKEKHNAISEHIEPTLKTVTRIQKALKPLGYTVSGYKQKNRIQKTIVLYLEYDYSSK